MIAKTQRLYGGFIILILLVMSITSCELLGLFQGDEDEVPPEIVIWTMESEIDFTWMREKIESELSSQEGLTVSFEYYTPDQIVPAYESAIQEGSGLPDIVFTVADHMETLVLTDTLMTTTDLFRPADLVEFPTYGGDYWALPITSGNHLMLYYNKSLISMTDVPQNTDELLALDPLSMPAGVEYWIQSNWTEPFFTVPFYLGYDGSIFAANGRTVSFDITAMANTLEIVQAMFDAGVSTYVDGNGDPANYGFMDSGFKNGSIAMIINGDWALGEYHSVLGDDLGIANIPTISGAGDPSPFTSPKFLFLTENSNAVEASIISAVAEHLISYPVQADMAAGWGRLPALVTAANDITDPFLQASAQQMLLGTPMPTNVELSIFWDAFKPNQNDFFAGGVFTDATEAAQAMQAAADLEQ